MKKSKNKILELRNLQNMILKVCFLLNRPIRKSQLINMVHTIFECNTPKEIEFAIMNLLEEEKLYQYHFFIVTPEFSSIWDGIVTAADESFIKFLLSLKEETKHDLYFDVFSEEYLTPFTFFKHIQMEYPALLSRTDTALAYMEQMDRTFFYGLSNEFYAEMNDYPINRWFTTFFNNPDCRIFIRNMDLRKKHVNFQLVLFPGRRRDYKKAHEQLEEFKQNICLYFDKNINIHIKTTPLAIITGNRKKI